MMSHPMRVSLTTLAIAIMVPALSRGQSLDTVAINALFARYVAGNTPGCAIAIAQNGRTIFQHAYGMADLERDVPNSVNTVFEAGSVSKQFVAAAVLILAAHGKLSLDDDIRKWFPELHGLGDLITVRHLLQHTSGLRDWGALAWLEGWPRGTRDLSERDVLTIMSRQRTLNHPVGEQFSYTNTGYNLAVLLVERASHESFPAFTQRELFNPIGMTHTSWRDDYARVVKGRAQAYSVHGKEWELDMPFENAYGNGGLLTTVADLLKWNDALTAHRIGTPDVSTTMETPGTLKNGAPMEYGFGLFIRDVLGVKEIGHDGATAGYRTFLARYPSVIVSTAVLCNAGDANGTALGRTAARALLPFTRRAATPVAAPASAPAPDAPGAAQLEQFTGTWRSVEIVTPLQISKGEGSLILERRPGLQTAARSTATPDQFEGDEGLKLRFERDAQGRVARLFVSVPRALNLPYTRMP